MGCGFGKCVICEKDILGIDNITEDTWYKIKYNANEKSWDSISRCDNCGDTVTSSSSDPVGITDNMWFMKAYSEAGINAYQEDNTFQSRYVRPNYIQAVDGEWYINNNPSCVATNVNAPWEQCVDNDRGLYCSGSTYNGYGTSTEQMNNVVQAINSGGVHPKCGASVV